MSGNLTPEILDEYKKIQEILRQGESITNSQRAVVEMVQKANAAHNIYDAAGCKLVWDSRLDYAEIESCYKKAFMNRIESLGNIFKVTQEAKENCARISEWLFHQQKPFLILQGTFGNGKTTSAKTLLEMIRANNFKVNRWEEDSRNLELAEYDACTLFEGLAYKTLDKERLYKIPVLMIDELGVEPQSYNDFGTIITPIQDLLRARYDRRLITIITTNLSGPMLRDYYGDRVFDRLKELAERVLFVQESFRGRENNSFMKIAK